MRAEILLRARCLTPERLLDRALEQGAAFRSVERAPDGTLTIACDAASARVLLGLCARYSLPARVLRRRGRSALLAFARRRATLAAGLVLCTALCALFLGRIWFVDIAFTGENAALGDAAALRSALLELGVRPGISRRLDTGILAQELLAACEGISHVGVRLEGVRLLAEAAPEAPAPELYDVEAPRDLVAGRDGIVVSATARSGALCVKPGDAVRRGQLLIRGEELEHRDETRPIGALGEVVIRTWYAGEAELPLRRERRVPTGRERARTRLTLAGLCWTLTDAEPFAEQEIAERALPIGGLFAPLELRRQVLREVRTTSVPEDGAALRARLEVLARADAAARLTAEGPRDYELVRSWVDFTEVPGGRLRARAVYEIYTDAAVTRQESLQGGH